MRNSHPRLLACLAAALLLAASARAADQPTSTPAAPATEVPAADADGTRSPGDMTVPERREMMAAVGVYNKCVYEAAMSGGDPAEDIRISADRALGDCEPRLQELASLIRGWGFPDYFATGFGRTIRDRAARGILPELAGRQAR